MDFAIFAGSLTRQKYKSIAIIKRLSKLKTFVQSCFSFQYISLLECYKRKRVTIKAVPKFDFI